MAFLVVLDSMTPAERVAFVLHDVFGYPFADIGEIVGRTPGGLPSAGLLRAPPGPPGAVAHHPAGRIWAVRNPEKLRASTTGP